MALGLRLGAGIVGLPLPQTGQALRIHTRADNAGKHPEIGDGLTIDVQDRQVAQVITRAEERERSIADEIAPRHAVA